MTHVIAEPCIATKDRACVASCPVDCIHDSHDEKMLFIDPVECIDCGACIDPCPVDAIFPEDELPEQWKHFTAMNAEYAKVKKGG